MSIAVAINDLRIIPRLALGLYGVMCVHVGFWYMDLPAPTGNQTTFATAIWGAAALWFNFYVTSGNKK